MTQLWWTVRAEHAGLAEVVAETADVLGAGAIGLLSTPTEYHVVRLDGMRPVTPTGPVGWISVFAARLFSPHTELRWVHRADGRGAAVVVAETAASLPEWRAEQSDAEEAIDGTYALWGRRFAAHPSGTTGWCRAKEGRLGHLDLPFRGSAPSNGDAEQGWPREYLSLLHREYVGFDRHGNATVVDERLIAVETAVPTSAEESH